MEPHKRRLEYQRKVFSMRQVRDCVEGSDAVKRSGELYLPMPSGMAMMTAAPSSTGVGQANPLTDRTLSLNEAPWYNSNPAYSAYVHRAKFPNISENTLRGLIGVSTREDPEVNLPSPIAYLEELATLDGSSLSDLYEYTLSEVLQVGRHSLVLDIRPDGSFYIAQYSSETFINWKQEVIDGQKVLTYAEFEIIEFIEEEQVKKSLIYSLEQVTENGPYICVVYHYTNGKLDEDGRKEILYKGKSLNFLPIVTAGSTSNSPEPDVLPMLGITDCALDIYRHSADLNNAHFLTCNPTLVFTGVDQDDAPRTIGSTVAICLSDPNSDAKYITTDSSGLSHVKEYIQDVFHEAVQYGASLIGPTKRAAESAEALSLRQSASGATLVTIVSRVGAAIEELLNMAAIIAGGSGKVEFEPNYEFAELTLSSQEILALMNLWMNGGISRDTLLTNLAQAGRLADKSPEEEAGMIDDEGVLLGKLEAEAQAKVDKEKAPVDNEQK